MKFNTKNLCLFVLATCLVSADAAALENWNQEKNIMNSIRRNNTDVPEIFIKNKQFDVNKIGDYTPLVQFVREENIPAVQFLIQQNADINLAGTNGMTPLLEAMKKNNMAITNILLEYATLNVNQPDDKDVTPLMKAAGKKKLSKDFVAALLKHGAQMDAVDKMGENALFKAARAGNGAALKYMMENGGLALANHQNANGQTILDVLEEVNQGLAAKVREFMANQP